jgi:hypothetical protein
MLSMLAAAQSGQQDTLTRLAQSEVFFPIALLILGSLLLLFGFKAYKAVVVFNCIVLGFYVGSVLGEKAKVSIIAAIVGAVVLGAISWPLMKYAVALSGGLVGAVCGMAIWNYFQPNTEYAWAGGIMGLILLGMLCFLLFKMSVILFTCLQGAIMLVLGASALLIRFTPWNATISTEFNNKPILMPLLVCSIAFLGIIYQQQKHGLLDHGAPPKPAEKK